MTTDQHRHACRAEADRLNPAVIDFNRYRPPQQGDGNDQTVPAFRSKDDADQAFQLPTLNPDHLSFG